MGYDSPNPIKNVFGTAIILVSVTLTGFTILYILKLALEAGLPEINKPV